MKKLATLGACLILFSVASARAGSKTGIGFEYGGGYQMPSNDYEARSIQSFALTMDLTEELSVSIFREEGSIRGENSYKGEDDAGDKEMDYTLINTGDLSITGLRFKHKLPIDLPVVLRAGLEVGQASFRNGARDFRATGGSGTPLSGAAAAANWTDVDVLDGTYPSLGLLADAILVSRQTETLSVSVTAGLAYRIINLPDLYSLGEEEAEFADPDDISEIDPVKSFNNLAVTVGLNIGF